MNVIKIIFEPPVRVLHKMIMHQEDWKGVRGKSV